MVNENYNKILMLTLMLLCAGVGVGSIYLMKTGGDSMVHIKEYLSTFFSGLNGNIQKTEILKKTLTENAILAAIIFICGFFRGGIPIVAICIARKGFIMGFTSASMLRSFGLKGLIINAAYIPTIAVAIPAFLFFAAISVKNSCGGYDGKKKFNFTYIIFAVITITIFCVAALTEAYLTTTFMNLVSPRL